MLTDFLALCDHGVNAGGEPSERRVGRAVELPERGDGGQTHLGVHVGGCGLQRGGRLVGVGAQVAERVGYGSTSTFSAVSYNRTWTAAPSKLSVVSFAAKSFALNSVPAGVNSSSNTAPTCSSSYACFLS